MNLLLDIISPLPEFSVFDDNKIIISRKIVESADTKLSESIIPSFLKIDKTLNLSKNLKSLIVTTGPGSYTALRVGVSFIMGQFYSNNVKLAALSGKDILNFLKISGKKNYGIYLTSANNQRFVCYKLYNKNYKEVKIESNKFDEFEDLGLIDILYYNEKILNKKNLNNLKQIKFTLKNTIIKNYFNLKYTKRSIIKPVYISNNYKLN